MSKSNAARGLAGLPIIWALVIALSFTLSVGLTLNISPWLRGDADWRWTYLPVFTWGRVAVAGVGLLLYVAFAVRAQRWARVSERRARWVIAGVVLLAIPVQLLVLAINKPDPLSVIFFRTSSPFESGFYEAGMRIVSIGEYLRAFPSLVANYLPHPQRHPPGLILYFAGVTKFLAAQPGAAHFLAAALHRYRCEYWPTLYLSDAQFAAIVGGLLAPMLNALAVVPLYAAARPLLGQRAALAAVLISPLIPAYVVWSGEWDAALPFITTLLLFLLYLALNRRRSWAWWVMGLLISVGSFLNYSVLPLVEVVGLYTVLEVWRERDYGKTHWAQLAANVGRLLLGGVSLWAAYWLATGVTFLEVYRANTAFHFGMSTTYASRLFYNPYDFTLFLGFPLGLLALAFGWQIARRALGRQPLSPAQHLAGAGLAMIATLTILNLSRAEVGRVWALYMPLAVFAAAALPEGLAHSTGRWLVTALLVGLQTIVMASVFVGHGQGSLEYPHLLPGEAIPVGARMGEAVELAGYNLSATELQPGDDLQLQLHWRSRLAAPGQYVVFVHVYDASGGLLTQLDGPPRDGEYPTDCWQPGEVITDDRTIHLSPQTAPGTYQIAVGMYDPADSYQRLPVSGAEAHDDILPLARIQVRP